MKESRRRSVRGMPFRNTAGSARRGGWKATLRALLVLLLLASTLAGAIAYSIVRRGLSAREEPSRAEEVLARAMRRWATPAATRQRANPVPPTAAALQRALEHYADHCATCHANDGSGDTTIGRGLYPRAPDMRAAATQALTDGELFGIIEHGIRLTGMPAWGSGTADGERESWALVHFVRHLPKLTGADLERMEALNPRTAAEWKAREEARRFLEGDAIPPKVTPQGPNH